jgi:xanthine dehydrogenase small subunit
MRDFVLLYINGKRYEIRGETAFSSLTDFLRSELQLTGTKVVCAEGDCGACTVLVGRPQDKGFCYETMDACIQFLYQLDCTHILTVEGLRKGPDLHPVQEALIEHHGSQCGFCTPGFVMALTGWFARQAEGETHGLRTALTGNLCRCTGYLPILEAGMSVDPAALAPLEDLYPAARMMDDFRKHADAPVLIQSPADQPARRTFFGPRHLEDAVAFKASNPETVIVSGGTELGVLRNKGGYDPGTMLSLAHIPGLAEIACVDETLTIGANVTWTQVEALTRDLLPEFHRIIVRFGSPQIRNVATLVANVAHGSPIADSLPILYVMDAELEVVGPTGTRRAKVNGFYKGYKAKDLAPDEIITRVLVPLPAADELLKLYKVSRRNDLDIATFGAAIRVRRAGDIITRAYLAFSGVAPTVVRLPATEAFLQSKLFSLETFRQAGRLARTEIQPISDVRGSRDFRLLLADNILGKFYCDCVDAEPAPCQ